ncbi:lactate dehydrogenase [Clostridium magnum]|uniref:L-lactate dehydrogenase n=1 Tax=Clostridium magnum DSM 2767 TaxID=1121326 RepID=A0A162QPU3_9CLOT|nr:lactate dehydrogenase [Clostridium magnum]KZL88803.1 L-lactate dehydrogenase [Clostridium magnum DSM 2767]SHI78169.1 Malate/lactate dehydrogenase [Clostridium magnum DSM 2767]
MNKKLFYYELQNKILIANKKYPFEDVSEDFASSYEGSLFALNSLDPKKSRRSFCVTNPQNLFIKEENLDLLKDNSTENINLPDWVMEHINNRNITSVNTSYPSWKEVLSSGFPIVTKGNENSNKWHITVVGLGDVGGTLITGLRLLGGDCISRINIFDKDENKMKRWEYECNQILSPSFEQSYPVVVPIKEDDLFNCDMFVFCVSVGVPEVGKEDVDVRLAQFQGNSKIISYYSKLSRINNFKGIFAVVSDPVDLLCKTVFDESNKDSSDTYDFNGLSPEQIRGYGLGVMNARASYYASQNKEHIHFLKNGRVFGPHGEGLIVADSIENYNDEISNYLTDKTKKANLEVRSIGFKPYVAPALSSGSLSLISTIKGDWHYSATFLGGAFMGCRNRLTSSGIELETHNFIPDSLFNNLQKTYNNLL